MRLTLIAAPATAPVSPTEAKEHLQVIGTAQDAAITAMLAAAVSHLDGPTGTVGRALIEQEWKLLLDRFPCDALEIPLGRLISVTSVKYVDPYGAEQTLAPSAYVVDSVSDRGVITPAYGTSWPATRTQRNAVTVQFKAGYGPAADDVPQAIRSAILLMVGDLFENREAAIVGQPRVDNPTVDRLLFPFKVIRP